LGDLFDRLMCRTIFTDTDAVMCPDKEVLDTCQSGNTCCRLQVVREDYIRTARAKGLKESVVVLRHALRNSMIPVITVFGPMFAGLVTGTVVIEQIFGLNGMGKHFIQSITNRDYPVLLGVMLVYTLILVFSNLLVDIMYGWLDPRISYD